MDRANVSFGAIVLEPAAWIPIGMSLIAFVLVMGHVMLYGAAREVDEGAVAHLWQILMAAQLPMLVWFSFRWLPRSPRQTLTVLALQGGAVLVAIAPVAYFHL